MLIEDEEVFGPVLTVNPFTTFDEAVTRANATRYGFQDGLIPSKISPEDLFAAELLNT